MQDPASRPALSEEEIRKIIRSSKTSGLRFTVDHYLLDYIKHCFLEEGQLRANIEKLQAALPHLEGAAKTGVEEVIKSIECVQSEYNEYLEDMRTLIS